MPFGLVKRNGVRFPASVAIPRRTSTKATVEQQLDATSPMNRIEELREDKRMTRKELAEAIGVTPQTIGRLEKGDMQLTAAYLNDIARALECSPGDLLVSVLPASMQNEVEVASVPVGLPSMADLLGHRSIRAYLVLADTLAAIGIRAGAMIWADETEAAIKARVAGDALLIRLQTPGILILRQFLPPALLTTNRFGPTNTSFKIDDRTIKSSIIGVILRPRNEQHITSAGSAGSPPDST